jgi:hypothetical protein
MAIQRAQPGYKFSKSTTPYFLTGEQSGTVGPKNSYAIAHAKMLPGFLVEKDLLITHPRLIKTATILHPFYIKIQPVQREFAATSDICDVYELGATPKQAVLNYLYALVDEITWFQGNKESMSEPMVRDFMKLQFYVGLI